MTSRRRWTACFALLLPAVGALAALGWPTRSSGAEACQSPEIWVFKREGALELLCGGARRERIVATFGAHPVGPKEREGDERTPEGTYAITLKTKDPRFHRFLGISYPNDDDRRRAKAKGIARLGGGIGIHGTSERLAPAARLWTRVAGAFGLAGVWGPTDGCIGVANEDVERLFEAVPVGTKVVIAATREGATAPPRGAPPAPGAPRGKGPR